MVEEGYSLDDIPLWKSYDTHSIPKMPSPDVGISHNDMHEEATVSDDLVDTTEEESSDVG